MNRGTALKNWCFTLNNYTEEERQNILKHPLIAYVKIGKEVGDNGTPHLQGYLQMANRKRLHQMKEVMPRAHFERQRGTTDEADKYCEKDGDFESSGVITYNGVKRVDMVKAVYQTLDGISKEKLLEEHGAGYIMNKRKIDCVVEEIRQEREIKSRKIEYKEKDLRVWQQEVLKKLEEQNDRKILFVIDAVGGVGKSWFTDWMMGNRDTFACENMKTNDIKYHWKGEKFVIFDCVRSSQEHLNYEIIELIKNGRFLSGKYEGERKWFKRPSVCVMLNCLPDVNKLSEDRYDLYII